MRRTLVLLLSLAGCGPTIQSGAFTVKKYYAERSFAVISNRAAFELGCPKDQLRLVTLNVVPDIGGDLPSQVGVEGCGQRAVYVQAYGSGWVMNTESSRKEQKGR
jgi:hypothetical protein